MPVISMTQRFPTLEFNIELLRHGISKRQIAEQLQVHPSQVSLVVNDLGSNARVRDFLLRILREMQAGTFTRLEDYKCERPDKGY